MKKIGFLFAFALALLVSNNAYALQCKSGNFGSDECWTEVQVASGETIPVIAGTVLVYDFTSDHSANDAAWTVRVAREITDGYKVAGVAQRTIATGDRGNVLVRGKGKVRATGAVTSGDRLYVSATDATVQSANLITAASAASNDKLIAFALATTSGSATTDAFITVI
jgi:hypothetical protein